MDENSRILISTRLNYTRSVPIAFVNCTSSNNLPEGLYPLPRCISNLIGSIRTNVDDVYNLDTLEKFKSKRKISHIVCFFICGVVNGLAQRLRKLKIFNLFL